MNADELNALIQTREPEGLKIDFKEKFYEVIHSDSKVSNNHWNELIKDVLALANGNIGTSGKDGFLVIGIADKLNSAGTREVFDIPNIPVTAKQILDRVNSVSKSQLPDLHLETMVFQEKNIWIIRIPPSPYLYEISKPLVTFNSTYPENSVFVRRKDGIGIASTEERQAILTEKKSTKSFIHQNSQDREKLNHPPFILPQQQSQSFIGREKELEKIHNILVKEKESRFCAVVGLRGVGKSALAVQFAHLHKDDFPDGIIGLRVHGKDENFLAREFARIAGEVFEQDDERDATTIIQEVFAYKKVLLILDNADITDINIVRALLPSGNTCRVIVTGYDKNLPIQLGIPDNAIIDLLPINDDEAFLLLSKFIDDERIEQDPSAVKTIAKLVGNLPLALEIAGRTLRLRSRYSLKEYAASLENEKTRLERLKVRFDPDFDIRATFNKTIQIFQEQGETQLINFFACLSACAETHFSTNTAMVVTNTDEYTAKDYLDYLEQVSLLTYSQIGENRFSFHPLIRLLARELSQELNQEKNAIERHTKYFIELLNSQDIESNESISKLTLDTDDIILAISRIDENTPLEYGIFAQKLYIFFLQFGYWQKGNQILSSLINSAEKTQDWEQVIYFRVQKAKLHLLQSELSLAETTILPIQNLIKNIPDPVKRKRNEGLFLNSLGGIQQRKGQFKVAIDSFNRAQAIWHELNDEYNLAVVLNSLGALLQKQGNFSEAEKVFRQSLRNRQHAIDFRGQAIGLNSLGGILQRQGKLNEAANAFRQSLQMEKRLRHKRGQAMVLNSLGSVLQRQSKFSESAEAFQESLELGKELGDNRHIALVLNSLGNLKQKQGKFDEAINFFERSKRIGSEIGDERHVAIVLHSMGTALQHQGHYAKSQKSLEQSLELFAKFGDKRDQSMVLTSLGSVLLKQSKIDEAIEMLEKSLTIDTEQNNKVGQSKVLNPLGRALQQKGKFDEALQAFQKSYSIAKELNDASGQAISLHSIGEAHLIQRNYDEALKAFEQSLSIRRKKKDTRGISIALKSIGDVLQKQGEFEKSIQALLESLEIERKLGNKHGLSITLHSLGRALSRQKNFDEALKVLQESMEIENAFSNRQGQAMVLRSIGLTLIEKGELEKGIQELSKSFEMFEKMQQVRNVAPVAIELSEALQKLRRYSEALDYCRRALKIAPTHIKLNRKISYLEQRKH